MMSKIDRPSVEEYEEIFKMVCRSYKIPFNRESFDYLLDNYYRKFDVSLNACHPRDIIEHVVDSARYYNHAPQMTRESIDMAWQNYFVD